MRLFCFHHAGGSALAYQAWLPAAPEWLQVCPVELPGRGRLLQQSFAASLGDLARSIALEVAEAVRGEYALFGHSLGAMLTYAIALELQKLPCRQPVKVFVAGARPPFLERDKPPVADMPDDEFVEHLRKLDGTPEAMFEDREFLRFFLPILRADYRLVENYVPAELRLIRAPLVVLRGLVDEGTPSDAMQAWSHVSAATIAFHEYEGGHFFVTHPAVRRDVFLALEKARDGVLSVAGRHEL